MGELVSGEGLVAVVGNIVNEMKQVNERSLDLTVGEVYALKGPGSVDFGGGEYVEPKRAKIKALRRPKDKHGWWRLKAGTYLVSLNETIGRLDGVGFISPHPRLLKVGCTHPTLFTLEWRKDYVIPLSVGRNGLKLKENARISKLMVIKV